MEAAITHGSDYNTPPWTLPENSPTSATSTVLALPDNSPTAGTSTVVWAALTGTTEHGQKLEFQKIIALSKARAEHPPQRYETLQDIPAEPVDGAQIFDAIQSLYLSNNERRDRKIAERITALYRDALAEDERILSASLRQFTDFFLIHPELTLPKITLTPDGTLRARWIKGAENFTAIEFTGEQVVKLVAEIPREGGLPAQYFCRESVERILSVANAIGASLS